MYYAQKYTLRRQYEKIVLQRTHVGERRDNVTKVRQQTEDESSLARISGKIEVSEKPVATSWAP